MSFDTETSRRLAAKDARSWKGVSVVFEVLRAVPCFEEGGGLLKCLYRG